MIPKYTDEEAPEIIRKMREKERHRKRLGELGGWCLLILFLMLLWERRAGLHWW